MLANERAQSFHISQSILDSLFHFQTELGALSKFQKSIETAERPSNTWWVLVNSIAQPNRSIGAIEWLVEIPWNQRGKTCQMQPKTNDAGEASRAKGRRHKLAETVSDIIEEYKLQPDYVVNGGIFDYAAFQPELTKLRCSKSELDRRIAALIERKQSEIDTSNRDEFLLPAGSAVNPDAPHAEGCARIDAADINRSLQIRTQTVTNSFGPQSIQAAMDQTSMRKRPREATSTEHDAFYSGCAERLQNLEDHLNILPGKACVLYIYILGLKLGKLILLADAKTRKSFFERLKCIEDRIMQLERDHPPWAMIHFKRPRN